jgi:hypothetical protein
MASVGQRRLVQAKLGKGSLKTLLLERVVHRAADEMPCASIIGPVVWIHAGASVLKLVPVFASVLPPLAKEGRDASGATRCTRQSSGD